MASEANGGRISETHIGFYEFCGINFRNFNLISKENRFS